MDQLLLHLLGDYILQNQWISDHKIKNESIGYVASLVHAIIYSIPFLIFLATWKAWLIILVTHFIIDKYQVANFWIQIMNRKNKTKVNNGIKIVIDNFFHLMCNYFAIMYF